MSEIPDSELEIAEFVISPSPRPGWEAEEVVRSYHAFEAEAAGTYTIEMRVDDRAMTVPISVALPDDVEEPV